MSLPPDAADDTGSLERARERLYAPDAIPQETRVPLAAASDRSVPHEWREPPLPIAMPTAKPHHLRLASIFFTGATVFFVLALVIAGYLFYFGGNSVSVNKVDIAVQGPTTIAGGDTVPLLISITNKNASALDDATIEVDFPDGTRSADNVSQPLPRYTEHLGTLASGQIVTRTIKAVVFGGAGQTLEFPISFSYGTQGSNATFVKKSTYPITISSTPLSVSVDTLAETVSGQPLTIALTVRSNTTVPISNVVLDAVFPFGFTVTSSSVPLSGSRFSLGTIEPGALKTIQLSGTLAGQDTEQRVFHFTVGTGGVSGDKILAYMTQDATVSIAAPFIQTTLALNGDLSANAILAPSKRTNVTVSYANTLATAVTNASVAITLSGNGVDYNSIQTTSGFYQSATHTVVFSRDTDSSLASLAPGASGIGTFSFSTVPANSTLRSPSVTFTISVSGTRMGQSNVPETVTASATKTAKILTTVALSAAALHTSGGLTNTGPIPPRANQATTYTIVWKAINSGSSVAGSSVSATLPGYVSYTGKTGGAGSFSYDTASRTVTWSLGDLPQGNSLQGVFQVSFTPSVTQVGSAPTLTSSATFSGYDRYAGVQTSVTVDPATTETKGDPGYLPANATVQEAQ